MHPCKLLNYAKNMARKQFLIANLRRIPFIMSRILSLMGNVHSHDNELSQFHNYTALKIKQGLSDHTLICHLKGALLKSSSPFPYFMLVAFEAGGILRALILLLLYPLICMVDKEIGLRMMVFICFVGITKESFRIGTSVLPKHFLEDVGGEGSDVLMMSWGKKVVVSDLPSVMIEGFLKDYMGIEAVVGRELKVINGYFVGLLDDGKTNIVLNEIFKENGMGSHAIGFGSLSKFLDHIPLGYCKEVYWVTNAEKRKWQNLPKERYPKPLIFHDGRLAFRPTAPATLALLMYIPLGILLFIVRFIFAWMVRYKICYPIIAFSGMRSMVSSPKNTEIKEKKPNGTLYACNHKTLIDPIYIKYALGEPNNLAAVIYSLSKVNEMLSRIKTVRLKRDREEDRKMIGEVLSKYNLVICPEGTTCREPYLLRFSPLFAEISVDIVPVAIDMKVGMFYGSTASGLKVFDPGFYLLNPCPIYYIKVLDKVPSWCTCEEGKKTKIEVANYVQSEIAKALGFECTNLTRRDKYMMLAGNSGDR